MNPIPVQGGPGPMVTVSESAWADRYAAGFRAGIEAAAKECDELRTKYNAQVNKAITEVGDTATFCAVSIRTLLDEPQEPPKS